ncbi:MAG: carbonic anhydrase [Candidatus Nanoarchaeia archaeon]
MVQEILKEVIKDNTSFRKDASVYEELQDKQTPHTTLITCSDSRVPVNVIKQDTVNAVFSIENIGNQIKTAEGSVDYGVRHLKTPLLLILGHTQCGAVKACFSDYSEETEGIQRELEFLSDGLAEMDSSFSADDPKRLDKYAEANVDYQVKYAMEIYRDLVESGQLSVVGMMMDFANSYSDEKGRVFITNYNGMKSGMDDVLGESFSGNIKRLVK